MKENYSPDEHRWENSQQNTCNSDTGTHQKDCLMIKLALFQRYIHGSMYTN